MNKRIIYLFLGCLIVIKINAQDGISEAKWQVTPIVIDGNDNEWSHPFNFYDNQSALIFSISNDSKNLYICFSNNDRMKTGKRKENLMPVSYFQNRSTRASI